jgi:hypothetical protein
VAIFASGFRQHGSQGDRKRDEWLVEVRGVLHFGSCDELLPSREVLYPLHSRHRAQTTIPPRSGAVPACELGGVFGATDDHAADWRPGQAKTGLMVGRNLGPGAVLHTGHRTAASLTKGRACDGTGQMGRETPFQ